VKSVERRSVEPKRQHLHRDVGGWGIPAGTVPLWKPVTFHALPTQVEPGLPSPAIYQSLYNRPPPSSGFIL
jgi:hypothetical protein